MPSKLFHILCLAISLCGTVAKSETLEGGITSSHDLSLEQNLDSQASRFYLQEEQRAQRSPTPKPAVKKLAPRIKKMELEKKTASRQAPVLHLDPGSIFLRKNPGQYCQMFMPPGIRWQVPSPCFEKVDRRAAQMGFRRGDRVLAVNGVDFALVARRGDATSLALLNQGVDRPQKILLERPGRPTKTFEIWVQWSRPWKVADPRWFEKKVRGS